MRSRPFDSYELVSVFDDRRSVEPQSIRTMLFPCSRLWASITVRATGVVESGASIYVQVLSLCASVMVPLTDTLDSSPRVSIRALALE